MLGVPVFQTVVIKQLKALVDDERHDAESQALLEHNEPPDATVSVLERVDSLIICMELCQSVQIMFVCCIVFVQKCRHARVNIFRRQGAG